MKLSPGKALLPGRKQIFRVERDGVADHDVLARDDEEACGRPLLHPVMTGGVRLPAGRVTLKEARACARRERETLPPRIAALAPAVPSYRVDISAGLQDACDELRRRYETAARGEVPFPRAGE